MYDLLFVNNIYYFDTLAPPPLFLFLPPAPGSRSDLYRKRKMDSLSIPMYLPVSNYLMIRSSVYVLYSANITPPAWSLVFKGVESTSRRTQAAAIAYMYPHHIHSVMKPSIHLRVTTACDCRIKLDMTMSSVSVPPQFVHNNYHDFAKVATVCDGGIDHHVSNHPPPQPKVSYWVE